MKNKYILLSLLAASFISCEPEFEKTVDADYSKGDADFTRYVAVGNSLTAGYMDGTMYKSGQMNSYPQMLSEIFATVGGGTFTQPSFEEDVNNLGGFQGVGGTRLVIDAAEGRPENIAGTPTITFTPQATAYNNMGVPGAKSFHLAFPGYAALNPYFGRHATTPTATVIGDALSLNPTFFTNWIGANDVLAYATSGGSGVDQTGNLNPATYGMNDITDPNVFAATYTQLIDGLTANGAKGVVCTIPSVTAIPYFTTVPYNALPAEATSSNATAIGLYQFLAAVTGGRIAPLNTAAGSYNPILIKDDSLSDLGATISGAAAATPFAPYAAALGAIYGKARHATANDLVVLPASSLIGQPNPSGTAPFNVYGVTEPMPNQYVLTATEKAKVATATAAYNNAIVTIAASKNLAVADMNAVMNELVSGLKIMTGQVYTANYFSGTTNEGKVLFSLDGVHPNARGYAVIANEFVKVINSHYNANLPFKNPSYYPGTQIVATNN